ncbi:MAG: LysM peptidoglycan-binding domain-containing protein [Akkermansiaceae bacterium]|jgi:LysM repeat protein|nr:LysM peptidoglycan-binding domain-containing protein [Akkermansiaceae bacterium]
MPKPLTFLAPGALALFIASCNQGGVAGNHPTGTGPFDARGNYVEEWADNPSKWNGRSVPDSAPQIASNDTPPVVQVQQQPRPTVQPTTQVVRQTPPTPRPTPRPTPVVKPKPKPKPQPSVITYTVRKGDTLYALAKRYGTTVGKIQAASGVSGSNIQIGQRLKIPRR